MSFWTHGTTITFGGTAIAGCTSIGLPDQSKEEVETTSHDSSGWREFVAGLRDGGTCALTARIRPGDPGQEALKTNYDADNVSQPVVITLPEHGDPAANLTFTFDAFVIDLGGDAPFDDAGERTYTLRITGVVTESNVVVGP